MTFRQEFQFLRDRARRLHEMATAHRTALSDQLLVVTAELEARADELQRQQDQWRFGQLLG
jgi:predicted nucleic acid-binding Zn ribbon protein